MPSSVVLFLLVVSSGIVVAQPKGPTASKQAATQSSYLTAPLSLAATTLGPNFTGHNIVRIIAELAASPLAAPKSEFETSAAYESRKAMYLDSKSRQYAFVLTSQTEFVYDADAEQMSVKVTASQRFYIDAGESRDHGFTLQTDIKSATKYVGSNALGVKATVTRVESDVFGVALSKDDRLFNIEASSFASKQEAKLAVDMDGATAKQLKPHLRVVLICTLVDPTVYVGTEYHSPTITVPTEITNDQEAVIVHPDQVWVYDNRSGKVITKVIAKPFDKSPVSETYRIGGSVSAPVATFKPEPEYSEEARKAKYQGEVWLSVVVDEKGVPQDIKVTRKLGLGLDEKAIEAVRKWRFKPGMKDGKPVAVQATIAVSFRL